MQESERAWPVKEWYIVKGTVIQNEFDRDKGQIRQGLASHLMKFGFYSWSH